MSTDWFSRLPNRSASDGVYLFEDGIGVRTRGFVCENTAGWKLTDLNGRNVSFSDFRGKVVILDFWATWCMPCRIEIPHFVELQKQYGAKGLAVIGVSLDEQGPDVVKRFVKQFEVNYSIVIGNEKIAEKYGGIVALPTTFVIDRQGRIVSQHIGYDDKEGFEKEIQSLL
jgi:thiol-disulfide isomerase/thioredoxin